MFNDKYIFYFESGITLIPEKEYILLWIDMGERICYFIFSLTKTQPLNIC